MASSPRLTLLTRLLLTVGFFLGLLWSFRHLAVLWDFRTIAIAALGAISYYFLFTQIVRVANHPQRWARVTGVITLAIVNILLWGILLAALPNPNRH